MLFIAFVATDRYVTFFAKQGEDPIIVGELQLNKL